MNVTVSGECMNRVYDSLKELDLDHLKRMWLAADPYESMGALLRYQISYAIERGWYRHDARGIAISG